MRLRGTLFAVLLVAMLAACGSGEPASSTNDTEPKPAAADGPDLSKETFEDLSADAEVTVDARDNTFDGQYVEVKAGTPVTFDNLGRNVHNVVPTEEGAFAEIPASDLAPKDEATITFEETPGGTLITMRSIFPTKEARDFVVEKFGAIEGGKQTLARLEDYLRTQ